MNIKDKHLYMLDQEFVDFWYNKGYLIESKYFRQLEEYWFSAIKYNGKEITHKLEWLACKRIDEDFVRYYTNPVKLSFEEYTSLSNALRYFKLMLFW